MKLIVRRCIIITFLVFIIAFFSRTHGDGFVHPNIKVITIDKDDKPIQNVSVSFFEELLEKHYESNPEMFMNRLKKMGAFKETNDEGMAILSTRFGIAVHYFEIWKMQLFPHTAIFSDGVIVISKENYIEKRVLINRKKYRKEILDERNIIFKIVLEGKYKVEQD